MNKFYLSFSQHIRYFLLLLISLSIFSSCSLTKDLQNNHYLLVKNKIKGVKSSKKKELSEIIKQQPNVKFLGIIKLKLCFYTIGNKGKENKLKWWLKNKAGEPPVIYDSLLAKKSTGLVELYLKNKGYFNASANYKVNIKHKKAKVKYLIVKSSLYTIRKIIFGSQQSNINNVLQFCSQNSILKKGDAYDVNKLQAERERITKNFKNEGYFYFNKEYVYFEIDSALSNNQIDIYVKFRTPEESDAMKIFSLDHVYLYSDTSSFSSDSVNITSYDTLKIDNYHIITKRGLLQYSPTYNWQSLIDKIFLKKGRRFSYKEYELSLSRLWELDMFEFVDIRFKKSQNNTANKLNCFINLTHSKRQSLTIEVEGNTGTEAMLGTALKFTYKNKNLFKIADILTFNVNGGVESQLGQGDSTFFNTLELSGQVSLLLPKFLLPIRLKKISQQFNPKTRITVSYNFQKRPGLTLTTSNISYGFDWKEFSYKRHILSPVVINFVYARDFSNNLQDLIQRNSKIRNSLSNQLIIGSSYTFIYNNQSFNKEKNFWFFRNIIDISGNLLNGINKISNSLSGNENNFKLFGLDYSQYAKWDVDLRHYFFLSKKNILVGRLSGGIGIAYGNSTDLPYVKQFFVGGSNSLRAWRIRTLGPGSFNPLTADSTGSVFIVDQTGDIKLESNIEYRFDIYKLIKGAVFVDIGNIWSIKHDTLRQGAVFKAGNLINDLAIGTGLGLRLDFSFLIFRLDFGIRVRDPVLKPLSETWVIKHINDKQWQADYEQIYGNKYPFWNFNIAIGYPF